MAEARKYQDFISSFEAGINSGIAPQLLPKNQLAFATNVSLRGGFPHPRPPLQRKTLSFATPELELLLRTAFFQGGGYYRPDFGTESLIASIGGHLVKFTENGEVWDVSDISIPNDLNDPITYQAWMWQSEKWLIVNDGTGVLPLFYDGLTTRRSYGPSQTYGITAAPFTVPAIGDIITISLEQAYQGPFGVPVIINKAFYEALPSTSGFKQTIKNIVGNPTTTVPIGTSVIINPNVVGVVSTTASDSAEYVSTPVHIIFDGSGVVIFPTPNPVIDPVFTGGPCDIQSIYDISTILQMEQINGVSVGDLVSVQGSNGFHFWNVTAIVGNSISLKRQQSTSLNRYTADIAPPPHQGTILVGTTVQFGTSRGASFNIGTTTAPFVVPSVGDTVDIFLNQIYAGTPNQLVFILGVRWYINTVALPSGTNSLVIQNLSDPFDPMTPVIVPAGEEILSVPELTAGRMGAYGMSRNWFSLIDSISYAAGDIVGGPSGTQANNYRDSVLKTTENDYLAGGGSFRLPGTGDIISAMIFPPQLDAALGQGPLAVGTPFSIFSNNSPVDRAVWTTMTSPLQSESLKGLGPLSQNATVLINSDVFFRSYDGFGSEVLARREFNGSWGNKGISNELQRITNQDNKDLLVFGSSLNCDNRFVSTVQPQAGRQGIFHEGLVALNLDLISSLRQTVPPSWEGLWLGLNALQIISGRVNGLIRSFAFNYNVDDAKIELYEILRENTTEFKDNGDTDITWGFESPVLFNKDVKSPTELMNLRDGEIYVSDIKDKARIDIFYKPDYYPCWVFWNSINLCNDSTVTDSKPTYKTRIGLGSPDNTRCETSNGRPLPLGYFFQVKVVVYGHCVFNGMRITGDSVPQPQFAPPPC